MVVDSGASGEEGAMPIAVAPERPVRRLGRPPVARFRADQLLVDTVHLPDVGRRHPGMDTERVRAAPAAVVTGPPATSFDDLESWDGHGTFVVGLLRQLAPAATIHVSWPEPEQYPARPCVACSRPRYERALAAGESVEHADDDDMDGGEIDDVAV